MVVRFAVVLFLAACFLSGCSGLFGWDLGHFSHTGVSPQIGSYSFKLGGNTEPEKYIRFIVVEKNKAKILLFSRDAYRYDSIPIEGGAFFNQWGEIGGTHCPTDSYGLSGHFTDPTHASGTLKTAYDCKIRGTYKFTTELKVP